MKVSIVIAVFNEAPTVATLLERVWAQALGPGIAKELLIVESASSDGSRELVAEFVARHPPTSAAEARAIWQSAARGKGWAVREGLAAATGDIVLIQDADLEYDTADYPELLAPIIEGRTALVLGSRHMGANGWKIRRFAAGGLQASVMNMGGLFFRALFNLVYSVRLSDPTTMYKVFRRQCLEGLTFSSDRFDFDYELLGKLLLAGYVPLEVPISYSSRGFDEGKKIRMFRDPIGWVAVIVKTRLANRRTHQATALAEPGRAAVAPLRAGSAGRQVASVQSE